MPRIATPPICPHSRSRNTVPSDSAKCFSIGSRKRGADGEWYQVSDQHRWKRVHSTSKGGTHAPRARLGTCVALRQRGSPVGVVVGGSANNVRVKMGPRGEELRSVTIADVTARSCSQRMQRLVVAQTNARGVPLQVVGAAQSQRRLGTPAAKKKARTSSTAAREATANPKPRVQAPDGIYRGRLFRITRVRGDGNCMFRAISKGLGDEDTRAPSRAALRRMAVTRIDNQVEWNTLRRIQTGVRSKAAYLREMAKAGTWGTAVELEALAAELGVTICVLFEMTNTLTTMGDSTSMRRTITLYYTGDHYDLLTWL